MNSFGTRCPSCYTEFKINADLLRLQDGHGACGQCGQIFDMQASMFSLPLHNIEFIKDPVKADNAWPELTAMIKLAPSHTNNNESEQEPETELETETKLTQEHSNKLVSSSIFYSDQRAAKQVNYRIVKNPSTPSVRAAHNKQTFQNLKNITLHTEEILPTSVTVAPVEPSLTAKPIATPKITAEKIMAEHAYTKAKSSRWFLYTCLLLLFLAALQFTTLFSREISQSLPFTSVIFKQFGLPTGHDG